MMRTDPFQGRRSECGNMSKQNLMARWLTAIVLLAMLPGSGWAGIRIGVAGPFTGQAVFRGEQLQQGAELAVANLNRTGGVLGQQVELLIADDACDAKQGVAVARKLVRDEVVLVVGHACSHASIPASNVYQAAGIVMMSPASTHPKLTDQGQDTVFRMCGRDDDQGQVAGDYLAEHWANARIGILHDGTMYGQGLAEVVQATLYRRGVNPLVFRAYPPGARDYSALVDELKVQGVGVVYIGGYAAEAALIVRQARDRGYDAQFVSGDTLTVDEFWMITGPAGEGTLVTFGPDPRRNQQAIAVVEQFREQGFEPAGYTLHTYAAIQAWAQAVERAGTTNVRAVASTLHTDDFDTVLGRIRFDQKGDVSAPGYIWYLWSNGHYAPLR